MYNLTKTDKRTVRFLSSFKEIAPMEHYAAFANKKMRTSVKSHIEPATSTSLRNRVSMTKQQTKIAEEKSKII